MYSIVSTAMIQGIAGIPVSVEADVSDGMPVFEMVGFLASEVKEAKERVRAALRNLGYTLPPKRITVNFTPADIRKSGAGFDLPVAIAVLSAIGVVPGEELQGLFVIGEIGLNGKIQPVHGVLPMIAEAKEHGIKRCMVPSANLSEAALVTDMESCGVSDIGDAICVLRHEKIKEAGSAAYAKEGHEKKPYAKKQPDFSDIKGQKLLRRACETAVSGMHNFLMIGPPGSGKTMLAMRIPSILPPLEPSEQMELSKIYSVSGLFGEREGLMQVRPFRAPHHTVTPQGLTGGGAIPKPGEISLAHKGVLFLDELPEFQSSTLEILRQPMEEKAVRLVRSHGTFRYPADFMLVAAMNPCRCGYYPDMQKCRCTQNAIDRYLGRISQPLIDRMDMCVEAPRLEFGELTGTEEAESSETIRERVICAQRIQRERYRNTDFQYNSQIPATQIRTFCVLNRSQEQYMEQLYKSMNLTARSYHKILKVARTLADMEAEEQIQDRHLNEAVCYRSLDKKFWEKA